MKQKNLQLLIGLIIVVIGFLLIFTNVLSNLKSGTWWAIILAIVAIGSIVRNGVNFGNLILIFIAISLFFNRWNWFPTWFRGKNLVGALVVVVGLFFLLGKRQRGDSYEPSKREDSANNPSYTAIFSGQEIKNSSKELDGTTLLALFGGLKGDFTEALIDEDIVIDASAIFGGIELFFPSSVKVESQSTPLFGGVENKTKPPLEKEAPTVTVRCLSLFGGVTIK
ncbi:MAG: LiaF domain-containing protein [Sphaerochaetaceae bacterium]